MAGINPTLKAGPGRPKGKPNKLTTQVKELILAALDEVGGKRYLVEQARANPTAFLTLLGKIIPHEVTGPNGGSIPHKIEVIFGDE